jgi:hypothetical protein
MIFGFISALLLLLIDRVHLSTSTTNFPFTVNYGVCTVALPVNISTTVTFHKNFIWPVPTARTLVGPCNGTATCTTVVPIHLKTHMPSGLTSLPPNFKWPLPSLKSCFPPRFTTTVALREHTKTVTALSIFKTTETEIEYSTSILSTATTTTTQSLITTTRTKRVMVTLTPLKMCTSFLL